MSTRGRSWVPSGRASPWECRAAQYRQVRPEEAQEPSWGTAKGALFERAGVREGALHRAHDLARMRQVLFPVVVHEQVVQTLVGAVLGLETCGRRHVRDQPDEVRVRVRVRVRDRGRGRGRVTEQLGEDAADRPHVDRLGW